MENVAKEGRTVLFVSHNMHAVRNLCERGIFLDEGKIVLNGLAGAVVDDYLEHSFEYQYKGQVDLRNWARERVTSGSARVVAARTLNKDEQIASVFNLYDPIAFEADLDNLPLNGFVLGFSVQNREGVFVYHLRIPAEVVASAQLGKKLTVRATIQELRVVEGDYSINIWLGDHFNTLHDRVGQALQFQVRNQGVTSTKLCSIIHEIAQWEIGTRSEEQ